MKFAVYMALTILGFLFILGVVLPFDVPAASENQYYDCIRYAYGVVDPGNGRDVGQVTIEHHKGAELHKWIEQRKYGDQDIETFEVTFDPETLLPVDYVRSIRNNDGETIIRIEVEETTVSVRIEKPDGNTATQRLKIPEEKFVIEPFFKYFVGRKVKENSGTGHITLLAHYKGKLKPFKMEWDVVDEETISVPLGKVDCSTVKIGSANGLLKVLGTDTTVWLNRENGHGIVRAPVRRGLFEKELVMELREYSTSPCGQPDKIFPQ